MAVDTAKKRFSMMNFSDHVVQPFAAPSGSVTQGDKQHLLDCYGGITFAGAAPGVVDETRSRLIYAARIGMSR